MLLYEGCDLERTSRPRSLTGRRQEAFMDRSVVQLWTELAGGICGPAS